MNSKRNQNLLKVYKSKNYENFLKENKISFEKFLSEVSNAYLEENLLDVIGKKFLKGDVPNETRILEKIKNICKKDSNSIIVPLSEICGIINLSIITENINFSTRDETNYKLVKISDVIDGKFKNDEHLFETNEYTEEQISLEIRDNCESITTDIVEKNDNLIITFN